MSFGVVTERRLEWTVVVLSGRVDSSSGLELSEAVERALHSRPPRLAFDFGAVDYLSSVGLRVLMESKKATASWRGALLLLRPQPVVLDVLTAAGLTRLFEIRDEIVPG